MGQRIDQLDIYGSVNNSKKGKDILEISKNSGTLLSPIYAPNDSKQISIDELVALLGISSLVSDDAYSSAWDGVTGVSPSKNAIYDLFKTIGYVPGNIAYQNIVGGDDATAVLGNQLRPFQTIGAAITALGVLTNALLICSSGVNNLYDIDCPQGLKPSNTTFDIYLETGCTVNYYGTYGVFVSNQNTGGNLYGNGIINNYSAFATGIVDGVSGYCINIGGASAPYSNKKLSFDRLLNFTQVHFIRIGDCVTNNATVTFNSSGISLIQSAYGYSKNTITLDTNSKSYFINFSNNGYIGNVLIGSGVVFKINNPNTVVIDRCNIYSHGSQFDASMLNAVEIVSETSGTIKFINTEIRFAGSDTGYSLINIKNIGSNYSNLLFDSCRLKNRGSNSLPLGGYSISSDNDIDLKIIDTYSQLDVNILKTMTNIISTGNGLMIEPNL